MDAGGRRDAGAVRPRDPNAVTDGWYGPVQPTTTAPKGAADLLGHRQPVPRPRCRPHLGDVKKGTAYVTSPSIDGTGDGRLMLSFGRYFHRTNVGMGNSGLYAARVSTDGGTNWTELERLEGNVPRWTMRTIDLSARVAPTATMRIRFEATDKVKYMQGGEPLVELLIDDVKLFRRVETCAGFTATDTMPPAGIEGTLTAVRAGRDVELRWVEPVPTGRTARALLSGLPLDRPALRLRRTRRADGDALPRRRRRRGVERDAVLPRERAERGRHVGGRTRAVGAGAQAGGVRGAARSARRASASRARRSIIWSKITAWNGYAPYQ